MKANGIAKPALAADVPLNVSVLVPTRGRPDRLMKSIKSLIDLADNASELQILIGIDKDDEKTIGGLPDELIPYLNQNRVSYAAVGYDRKGYARLHEYYNDLAAYCQAKWIMVWNDDAVMKTPGWDSKIKARNGKFCVLAFDTHNHHPYSIFPVVPRDWYALVGCLSNHQMVDSVISQMAYHLDVMEYTDIQVDHERFDFTGENPDETYRERELYENNINDPRDLNHPDSVRWRYQMIDRIAWYLKSHGQDVSWWINTLKGKQDPFEKMRLNDPNGQVYQGTVNI